jgi:hypothetical protein
LEHLEDGSIPVPKSDAALLRPKLTAQERSIALISLQGIKHVSTRNERAAELGLIAGRLKLDVFEAVEISRRSGVGFPTVKDLLPSLRAGRSMLHAQWSSAVSNAEELEKRLRMACSGG